MENNFTIEIVSFKDERKKYHEREKTEEIRDIIERMPKKFGFRISLIVLFIFSSLLIFGWTISYPDVVRGQVTINTSIAPVKLVATIAGKIKLNQTISQSKVKSGDIIAYIESATSFDTLQIIKKVLAAYNPNDSYNTSIISSLPSKVALGELTSRYYIFLSALHQMANFNNDKLYEKQIRSLLHLYHYQTKEVKTSSDRIDINKNVMEYSKKFFLRDSVLLAEKVAAEAELDRSKMAYLNSQSNFTNAQSGQIEAEKQAQQTFSKITEVDVQKNERRKELQIALLAAYNDLVDNIVMWEQRYLFKAPFDGKIQFLRFWTDNQFVSAQEPVFTVIPENEKPYGQVSLPALGAGKVKTGQKAIVKLDDFPFNEYGSITGIITSISLTTNTEKTQQGNLESYLVTLSFPKGLTTNYNEILAFRHETKGSAEIITKDRRLIERLFDNIKYTLKK